MHLTDGCNRIQSKDLQLTCSPLACRLFSSSTCSSSASSSASLKPSSRFCSIKIRPRIGVSKADNCVKTVKLSDHTIQQKTIAPYLILDLNQNQVTSLTLTKRT